MYQTQVVPLESIIPLRHKVLRPGRPVEECTYKEDLAEGCFHVATLEQGKVIGIASFYPESHQLAASSNAWRLRGMATDPDYRARGLGAQLLMYGMDLCAKAGGDVLWCNARTEAVPFYSKLNFVIKGEEFQIAGIGPHYFMSKTLV
ncbi:GNAT family N-acetyltransferase [Kangiella sp.]|uniref:GNAT family N-acetyltransferase n=1 Tax=Kangiella sp. TaxID=1920245 RepID=UPI001992774C|nr:GNAT family N-acetyltransferase [Kangiella sp.]MBD3652697.1 GNAT family N-acetyltransferase [Kangiella sp.]